MRMPSNPAENMATKRLKRVDGQASPDPGPGLDSLTEGIMLHALHFAGPRELNSLMCVDRLRRKLVEERASALVDWCR